MKYLMEILLERTDDTHISVSSQFFGWLTGVGSGMRIVGPEDVKQQYKEYLQSVLRNY
ncbi:hypothetical protein [Blautia sp.]